MEFSIPQEKRRLKLAPECVILLMDQEREVGFREQGIAARGEPTRPRGVSYHSERISTRIMWPQQSIAQRSSGVVNSRSVGYTVVPGKARGYRAEVRAGRTECR